MGDEWPAESDHRPALSTRAGVHRLPRCPARRPMPRLGVRRRPAGRRRPSEAPRPRCPTRRSSRRSGPCWRPRRSMARGTGRCALDCGREAIGVGRNRVLRLMRRNGLLAPQRAGHRHGDPAHDPGRSRRRGPTSCGAPTPPGSTRPRRAGAGGSAPSTTRAPTSSGGTWRRSVTGGRPSSPCTRASELAYGAFEKDVARGLAVRSDWGPQYAANAFRNELAWLGITHSPSFVGEPQCNGVIERFIRTLKEQCLWRHRFETEPYRDRRRPNSLNQATSAWA